MCYTLARAADQPVGGYGGGDRTARSAIGETRLMDGWRVHASRSQRSSNAGHGAGADMTESLRTRRRL
jgi:hypothetical protein